MFARSDDSDDSQELTHIYPTEDSALERDGSRLAQRSLSVAHAAACSRGGKAKHGAAPARWSAEPKAATRL